MDILRNVYNVQKHVLRVLGLSLEVYTEEHSQINHVQ